MTEKRYFAAANTTNGFLSYYSEIFGKCKSVYIIKGGSGTGKSRFMRECADYAIKQNEQAKLEYFYCSFDPDSLDGVIINDKLAVIDGTSPHIYEPTLAGAKENLVDFGAFWDVSKLQKNADEIYKLSVEKKKHFASGYSYLGAYGRLDEIKRKYFTEHFDEKKALGFASKLITELNISDKGEDKLRIFSAFGKKGEVEFDTYTKNTQRVIKIHDEYSAADLIIEKLQGEARRFSIPITISYHPLFKNRLNGISFGESLSVVATGNAESGDISTDEYFASNSELKRINKIQAELLDCAKTELKNAFGTHLSVEKIYIDAMDFHKKEEFTADFVSKNII